MKRMASIWIILMLLCSYVWASHSTAFNEAEFKKLQKQNAPVLIDVYAGWCSTCLAQSAVLKKYQKAHPDSKLHILRVDFDHDKKWVRYFRPPRQGTLVFYQGKKRIWFNVGETREDVIFKKLNELTGA